MSALGQEQTLDRRFPMSAKMPRADILGTDFGRELCAKQFAENSFDLRRARREAYREPIATPGVHTDDLGI
jgi:hypothetical protein